MSRSHRPGPRRSTAHHALAPCARVGPGGSRTAALRCRCGSNNSAMFSEIVPEEQRSTIFAFDRSFEGGVGACAMPLVGGLPPRPPPPTTLKVKPASNAAGLGAPKTRCISVLLEADTQPPSKVSEPSSGPLTRWQLHAGFIAERAFGYSGSLGEGASADAARMGDAAALSSSLLVCLSVPWFLCWLFYFGLYRTYPRDRRLRRDAGTLPTAAKGRPGGFRDTLLPGSGLPRLRDD